MQAFIFGNKKAFMKKKDKFFLFFSLIIVPIAYLIFIYYHTTNNPLMDDYDAILKFLNTFVESKGISSRIKLLFSQHNEHRIFFVRLFSVLDYYIFGEVNFKYLILVGNFFWLLIIFLLFKHFQSFRKSYYLFIPVIFILFSPTHPSIMTWAMTSIQQYSQILFSLLAIYFFSKEINTNYVTTSFLLGIIFLTFSNFTGGGGIALSFTILLMFLISKSFKKFSYVLITSISISYIYFVTLEYNKMHTNNLFEILINFGRLTKFFFFFIGSLISIKILAFIISITLLNLFLYLSYKRYYKKNSFLFYSIVYIYITASLVSLGRSHLGADYALSNKYSIYSILLLSIIYISFIHNGYFRKKNLLYAIFLIISISLFSYSLKIHYKKFYNHKNWTWIVYINKHDPIKILDKSFDLRVYNGSKHITDYLLKKLDISANSKNSKIENYKNRLILSSRGPTSYKISIPKSATFFNFGYGIKNKSNFINNKEGACFKISSKIDNKIKELWKNCINPKINQLDRNILKAKVQLSTNIDELQFETAPIEKKKSNWERTFWTNLGFIILTPNK